VKRTRQTGILLASAVAVTLLSAGCQQANPTTPQQSAPPSATTNQTNPKPRDQVQDGGKLTWPINGEPANFNYNELDGTDLDGFHVLAAAMPTMFHFDGAANPTFAAAYLTGEPTVVTTPKQVITYSLNPKAIWYDGTPITAADFIAQWKAITDTSKKYLVSGTQGYEDMESVAQGKDQFEVVVTFKKVYADWKALFSPLYPASTNTDPKVFNEGWKGKLLTTAGPFKFQNFDATTKTYTLVKNEKWWGDPAKLDTIIYRVIEPDAEPEALANGEIDFMDIGSNVDYYNKVKAIPGVDIRQAGGPNFRHITINGQSEVLKDVNVRKALAMGIDREALAKSQLGPLGVEAKTLDNHIFMRNQVGYQDNSGDVGKFDQTKAKAALDAAGWTVQGSDRVKDGKKLEISFVIPSGVAASKDTADLVQNMLAQINVKANVDVVPIDDFFDKYVTPGKFDFTIFSWIGTPFPISSGKSIYANPKGTDIQQNYARVGSQQIDDLYSQATSELDPTKAAALANQVDALIWQEVHSLTLFQRPELVGTKSGLANYGAHGFADDVYENIGWTKS
jgi:peptide/nickel transport system substrate-binding protein